MSSSWIGFHNWRKESRVPSIPSYASLLRARFFNGERARETPLKGNLRKRRCVLTVSASVNWQKASERRWQRIKQKRCSFRFSFEAGTWKPEAKSATFLHFKCIPKFCRITYRNRKIAAVSRWNLIKSAFSKSNWDFRSNQFYILMPFILLKNTSFIHF